MIVLFVTRSRFQRGDSSDSVDPSPSSSQVRAALVLGLVVLLAAMSRIPIALTSGREPGFFPTGQGAGETFDQAVVRAGSGSILQAGSPITLPVEAGQVQDLGAATVVVGYDPAVLTVAGCRRNPAFNVGLCNTDFDRNDDGTPDAVHFNLVSLDGLSAPDGTPLSLVDIGWIVDGSPDPGSAIILEVEVPTFTDTDALPISVSAENGQVMIGIAQVRVPDIMRVAARWGEPAAGGNEQLDLVPDGIIDVQDVSALAEHWRGTWP